MLILGQRCPAYLGIRSFHGCTMGASPSRSAHTACRAAVTGAAMTWLPSTVHLPRQMHGGMRAVPAGYAHARGFRKRPHRAPSSLRSAEHLTDEGHYEAGQVDDWGVNRDMQQEYRCSAPPFSKQASSALFSCLSWS